LKDYNQSKDHVCSEIVLKSFLLLITADYRLMLRFMRKKTKILYET